MLCTFFNYPSDDWGVLLGKVDWLVVSKLCYATFQINASSLPKLLANLQTFASYSAHEG